MQDKTTLAAVRERAGQAMYEVLVVEPLGADETSTWDELDAPTQQHYQAKAAPIVQATLEAAGVLL